MEEFIRFINTEQGLQFVIQLSAFVTAISAGAYLIFTLAVDCIGNAMIMIGRRLYTHTKYYKKKHEKILSLFVPCVHIVRQLYEEKLIDKEQGLMLLNSLEEYKDNHTKD